MRNHDLIHSIAQSIIDKHYDDELEHDHEEDSDSFHTMFEPADDSGFWDRTVLTKKDIFKNIIAAVIILALSATTIISALTLSLAFSLTHVIIMLLINAAFYTDRLRNYSRDFIMVNIFGLSMLLTAAALILSSSLILFKMFNP